MAKISVDPNVVDHDGLTAICIAVNNKYASVVKLLLTNVLVNPNIPNNFSDTPLMLAAQQKNIALLEVIFASSKVIRIPPSNDNSQAQAANDTALPAVKKPRNARFRGLTWAMIVFRRMRLRAANIVYVPGGAGFAAAAASFNAVAANNTNEFQI